MPYKDPKQARKHRLEYYKKNKDKIKARATAWNRKHKDLCNARRRESRKDPKKKAKAHNYYIEEVKPGRKERVKERYHTDPGFKEGIGKRTQKWKESHRKHVNTHASNYRRKRRKIPEVGDRMRANEQKKRDQRTAEQRRHHKDYLLNYFSVPEIAEKKLHDDYIYHLPKTFAGRRERKRKVKEAIEKYGLSCYG